MRGIDSFADLDALALACRDGRSRELLAEAVACYRAGAFRSSIVMTWAAVVFDFVHKLRELDLGVDAQARTLLERFEQVRATHDLSGALKFEREVIEQCGAFEFVSPLEKTDLQRLYDDRNRCAHPAMRAEDVRFDPPPELARVHMRTAVETMLGRPATQGKAALASVHAEVTSTLFPKDWTKAKLVLDRGPLGRPKPSLLRGFVISTMKRLLDDSVDRDDAERLAAALRASAAMHPAEFDKIISEPGFSKPCTIACSDGRGRRVVRLVALVPDLRRVVFEALHVQLDELLQHTTKAEDLDESIHYALDVVALKPRAMGCISDLKRDRLAKLIAMNARPEYVDQAVLLYLASPNYDWANFTAENLVLPLAQFVRRDHAESIAQKAREPQSQVGGGWRFAAVKARLEELGVWPPELIQVTPTIEENPQ